METPQRTRERPLQEFSPALSPIVATPNTNHLRSIAQSQQLPGIAEYGDDDHLMYGSLNMSFSREQSLFQNDRPPVFPVRDEPQEYQRDHDHQRDVTLDSVSMIVDEVADSARDAPQNSTILSPAKRVENRVLISSVQAKYAKYLSPSRPLDEHKAGAGEESRDHGAVAPSPVLSSVSPWTQERQALQLIHETRRLRRRMQQRSFSPQLPSRSTPSPQLPSRSTPSPPPLPPNISRSANRAESAPQSYSVPVLPAPPPPSVQWSTPSAMTVASAVTVAPQLAVGTVFALILDDSRTPVLVPIKHSTVMPPHTPSASAEPEQFSTPQRSRSPTTQQSDENKQHQESDADARHRHVHFATDSARNALNRSQEVDDQHSLQQQQSWLQSVSSINYSGEEEIQSSSVVTEHAMRQVYEDFYHARDHHRHVQRRMNTNPSHDNYHRKQPTARRSSSSNVSSGAPAVSFLVRRPPSSIGSMATALSPVREELNSSWQSDLSDAERSSMHEDSAPSTPGRTLHRLHWHERLQRRNLTSVLKSPQIRKFG